MMTERSEVKMGAKWGGQDRDQRLEAGGGGWGGRAGQLDQEKKEASKAGGTQG